MERRSFLRNVALGSAVVANFLYPGVTSVVRAQGQNPSTPNTGERPDRDPNFFGGTVVERTPEGIVLAGGDELKAVRITDGTAIWREFYGKHQIHIGDYVDVRGTALPDATLQAESVWVNIGRLDGVIEEKTPVGLTIATRRGRKRGIEFSNQVEVISSNDGSLIPERLESLANGMFIGAVGLRLPNDGFRATRIWKWEQNT